MKIVFNTHVIVFLLAVALVFSKCSNKKYGYTYLEEGEELNTVKEVPFKANDFRINFRLALDSVILNKEKPAPVFVKVNISGQQQYWPKDLKIEIYCNEKRVQFQDSIIKFSVSSVINDQVRYFDMNASDFVVTTLVEKTKQEHNIPDSVNYYKVACSLNTEHFVNDSNLKEIKVKLKAIWNRGTETIEKNYILTKVDITKYPSNPRLYG